ncbi:putative acyltransferase; membrane protein [Bradyrhizobium sp. ORS 375]|uniref:acyltransferase family protein n=1 Tax=Bradyrhizobium sp. (strain ORS 375) TaxID=566679 RepID=UPI0002405EA2|nr:acyltransferase [Bradyrhizobium sp. ORS 375]CCD94996.1 putative acyltransferase; membrane protein [Bradyrhizobium sp. ORS 375]
MAKILAFSRLRSPPSSATSGHPSTVPAVASVAPQTSLPSVIPSLDGIRALSVLIVVLGHSGLQTLIPGGFGVTIFFFLSGYLITTLMLSEHERTGTVNVTSFYARRVFRLMPPLLLTLTIAYGLTFAGLLDGGITAKGLAAQLLYFANYYGLFFDPGNTVPDGTGILWSLAVEEHFYIVYPLVMTLLLGAALRPRSIGVLLGLVCLGVLAWRIHLVHAPGFFSDRTYYASDTRIDSIAYGCILALVMNPARQRSPSGTLSWAHGALMLAAAATLLLSLLYRDPTFRETVRYSIQGLALMPLFYLAIRFADAALFRPLNRPWIRALGSYSYAIYLIHYVVIRAIDKNYPAIAAKPYLLFPSALLVSILYAAAIERFVEPYFRNLRHQFRPGSAGQGAAHTGEAIQSDARSNDGRAQRLAHP